MASATIENLTVPGDAIHWGDTIRITPSGMPSGKNYASIKAFAGTADVQGGTDYTDRKTFNHDALVEFTIGASSQPNPVNNGSWATGATQESCYAWLDNDSDLSNGVPPGGDLPAFLIYAPR